MATVTFRRVTRTDFALLGRWLSQPYVARWWNHQTDPEALERDFGPSADDLEPSQDHLALLDGEPFGLVQYSRYADYPDDAAAVGRIVDLPQDAACIDYLIGVPDLVGRGMGTAMLSAFCEQVWRIDPIPSCIVVPVSSANPASWRTLLSCGFRLVGRGDLPPDNPIDDDSHELLRLDRPVE